MFRIRLKELRENLGLSQYAFADRFGVAQSTVGNWESGIREPNFDTIQRLADFFGVSVDYLLGRSEKNPLNEQLKDVDFALYGEVKDLTDEDKEDVIEFIRFKKSLKNKK